MVWSRGPDSGTGVPALYAHWHSERLFTGLPRRCGIGSVLDGHPATLAWLGAVYGHRVRPLGVGHFGQISSIADRQGHRAGPSDPSSRSCLIAQ
jgi:hypothetical protein